MKTCITSSYIQGKMVTCSSPQYLTQNEKLPHYAYQYYCWYNSIVMHILLNLNLSILQHCYTAQTLLKQQDKMQIFNVISNDWYLLCGQRISTFSFIWVCACDHIWTIDGMSTKWIQSILFNRKIHCYCSYKNTMLMSKLQTLRNIQKNCKTRYFI